MLPQCPNTTAKSCRGMLIKMQSLYFSQLKCLTRYRHLGCQPAIIDAKHFSPQLRRRLFWGNIPGLFTINKEQYVGDAALMLETSLMPNSGRRANQDKVRTLTTNTNSLLQGRVENCSSSKDFCSLFPVDVLMDKVKRIAWTKRTNLNHPSLIQINVQFVSLNTIHFIDSRFSFRFSILSKYLNYIRMMKRTFYGFKKSSASLDFLVTIPMLETSLVVTAKNFWDMLGQCL